MSDSIRECRRCQTTEACTLVLMRRGAGEFGFGGGLRVEDADDILRHEAAEQFLARGGIELARLAADLGAMLEHRGLERPEMLPCDRRQALRCDRDEILNLLKAPPWRVGRGSFTASGQNGRERPCHEQWKRDRRARRGERRP